MKEHLIKQAALGEFDGLSKESSDSISVEILSHFPKWVPRIAILAIKRLSEKSEGGLNEQN